MSRPGVLGHRTRCTQRSAASARGLPGLLALLVWLTALALPGLAQAHKASDAYLALTTQGPRVQGQWDIALRDLDQAIGLDQDDNAEITWGEVRSRQAELFSYALARLGLQADGQACRLTPGELLVDEHTDGGYAVLRFAADCTAAAVGGVAASASGSSSAGAGDRQGSMRQLQVDYRLFADLDPQHRGLLRLQGDGQAEGAALTAVFSPANARQVFTLAEASRWHQFSTYLVEGIWHIWIGFDHILFLLSLLLPAVLVWQRPQWQPVARLRTAVLDVVRIVSAFTLAHSITLSLAALGLVALPSRLVESAIAASVVLAALNNLWPVVEGRRWAVAFGFGLIHGFGFASVLADLGLPQGALALALVGFNVGVELGQLAIVAVFLPLAFALRRSGFYRWGVFTAGSVAIALLAAVWLAERAFDIKLLPG